MLPSLQKALKEEVRSFSKLPSSFFQKLQGEGIKQACRTHEKFWKHLKCPPKISFWYFIILSECFGSF
jgi:hypothetical protein